MKLGASLDLTFFIYALWLLDHAYCFVRLDIGRQHLEHNILKRNAENEVLLENVVSYYRAEIYIGTPPQAVSVQIDTGSSDLWVISTENTLCRSMVKCPTDAMFDPRKSSTFHRNDSMPFSISYGDLTFANGTFAQDVIMVGTSFKHTPPSSRSWEASPGLTLQNANFAVAETANSTEAVLGIGMESTESMVRTIDFSGHVSPTYPNLPVQLKEQGHITTIAYSLWLNDLNSSQGSLLFGGVDHLKYVGRLQSVPMVSSYRGLEFPIDFSVMLHGISAYNDKNDSASLITCSLPFLLDSGTTYSQLPREFLGPIMDTIGAVYDEDGGFYVLEQKKRAALSGGGLIFNLSGVEISVPFEELLIPVSSLQSEGVWRDFGGLFRREGDTYDARMISPDSIKLNRKYPRTAYLVGLYPVSSSAGGAYILGDTFLRSAYAVYDLENKEVLLANTVYNSTDSQIESIGVDGVPGAARAPRYFETLMRNEIGIFTASDLFFSNIGYSRESARSDTTTISQFSPRHSRGVHTGAGCSQKREQGKRNCGVDRSVSLLKGFTSFVITALLHIL